MYIYPSILSDIEQQESLKRNWLAVTDQSGLCMVTLSLWNYWGPVSLEQRAQLSARKSHGKVLVSFKSIYNVHPYTATLNYPPERSSLPAHPRKCCDHSSAVQAAVEGNLVDSVTRATDDRTRPARHPKLSPRWRSCHANPTWQQMNTSRSIAHEEIIKRPNSTPSFLRLYISSVPKLFFQEQ